MDVSNRENGAAGFGRIVNAYRAYYSNKRDLDRVNVKLGMKIVSKANGGRVNKRKESIMRSLEKAVAQGREITHKRPKLDITCFDLYQLKEVFDEQPNYDGLLEVMIRSYLLGLAVGYRNARSGRRQDGLD